jgi:predicted transcriptional regulator
LRHDDGFDGPHSVESTMLILPDARVSLSEDVPRTVGITCRICPRKDCVARREMSILSDG